MKGWTCFRGEEAEGTFGEETGEEGSPGGGKAGGGATHGHDSWSDQNEGYWWRVCTSFLHRCLPPALVLVLALEFV